MSTLVFIDTNIFLDFYRVRAKTHALEILQRIDENHSRIITGSQVEMEFKRNRQRVILDSWKEIKSPSFESVKELPAFLADSKQSKALRGNEKKARELATRLKARALRVLENPTRHDPVYKSAQRLFRSAEPYNLNRTRKERFAVRRLARKRFCLGYPPRKANDTSIGDAVNWEWIVQCAIDSGADIVIVSRDTDYGAFFEGRAVLNDWLLQEFKERVSQKRKIRLTDRLTDAMREASISVSPSEEKAEKEFLSEQNRRVGGLFGAFQRASGQGTPALGTGLMNLFFDDESRGLVVRDDDEPAA